MARKVNALLDMEFDEISLVDKGANQYARTVIAKRHGEEENTMDEYFDSTGNPVEMDSLEPGEVVYDAQGDAFTLEVEEEADERELATVGKNANPFVIQKNHETDDDEVFDLREELSKALTDSDRDEVIAKAFNRLGEYEEIAKQAQAAAESERQLRLDREYTEVAKNYTVGIAPEVLGPVLKRAAEALDRADCEVLAKALDSASAAGDLFEEVGKSGAGSNSDVFQSVEAKISESISKGDTSKEQLITKAFLDNPAAYDEYLAEQYNR
jgi:hypothetical protein